MKVTEELMRNETIIEVARRMMAAARTAPKARGIDNTEIMCVTGEDLGPLVTKMREIGEREEMDFFLRDADNIEFGAGAVVLLGTRIVPYGLNCGYCGFMTCAEKAQYPKVPCSFNTGDLGIAIGSASSVAADNRLDSRVMYSAGRAALELGLLEQCSVVYAIALSCTSKNIFFDRPPYEKK